VAKPKAHGWLDDATHKHVPDTVRQRHPAAVDQTALIFGILFFVWCSARGIHTRQDVGSIISSIDMLALDPMFEVVIGSLVSTCIPATRVVSLVPEHGLQQTAKNGNQVPCCKGRGKSLDHEGKLPVDV
jgi:hypothetical protein